ncbi:myo-inositol 2-dehydrogenase [Marinomonas rhizomae]|uniref:Myo-inositol 2-dehydrogenase/D-chiro-inositol 1-dehydrogenase n=1 Tax=Marinomonas rhizomae TaxID=491948 RepID=A0A366JE26_9GAMM|nr:Gfo/Idh/MocA family oxidoreductase [Marinomonas rhizomae]RBP85097.1 myo-inositol 2-dehydrogenase/D-chiro-inositol 1-dehydrogenase [Marinomonas rhizomae]RNF76207.1 myo-inositol 2-dehydrogenase [Marinomonas rhizomae]
MSIRVALIGTGIMGMDHARIFAEELPHVELRTICDVSAERARYVADQFGIQHAETDALKVIASKEIDAVVIASPDHTHTPLTLAAIKAGKPVLCEKPLATSSQECLTVIEEEMKLGKKMVQLGFMRRFDPAYTAMKKDLLQGKIGQAVMFHCFHRNVEAPANFTGQMAISNSAPHEFDAARFILDEEVNSISVFQPQCLDTSKVGAPVFMVLETESGRLINIEINNNAAYGYDVRGELVGEKGSIALRSPVLTELHSELQASEAYAADWRPRFAEAYRLQNKAWIQSIMTNTPSPIASDSWDGYCATLIAEAGVQALSSGTKTLIHRIEKPTFYL